ncbi:tripartite ATP-independent periplasmic transporter solute receptor, DctP family [Acidovorax sp. CF316]|uniref:TRAP transporter substrate-binding protein n=1 Tax=Acidovorax sp. CF316 TaxID=1144317 RepID=UPI00026BE753|nr:TRAP transporter substrate-binding protein [Acidovorax sp. CF316]EJE52423.1 tripartite ATP-independent periplasmic transporter solute receptor, DctP family [Acidovorax sp. CF316]
MTTSNLRRAALATIGALALACTTPSALAQDIKERNLKFAFSLAKDHPLGQGAQKFADLVAQKSGGKIKVTLFANAVLGSDTQNLSAVRGGTLDFASMATGLLAGIDKQFMVFDFPFLFDSPQEAYGLADGPVGTRLQAGLAAHGIVGMGIWDLGFRNMTNSKRPIARHEDLQGLKLRVIASPIYLDMFNTLGANPVPMTFGEVYGALESKAIDGQDNPVGVIESAKFAEVQKYLSLTRHVYTGMPVLMSKKTWDGMSEAERKLITDAANEAKQEERRIAQAKEAESITNLRKTMQVNDVAPAELARLRQKVQPVVDKFAKEVGEPLMTQVNAELARMRGAGNK